MLTLDVNTTGAIEYSKKLDRIGKYALPVAVRQTLSSVAFDAKRTTIPQEAAKAFTQRDKTFFKRFSKAVPAKGLRINSMKSVAGMIKGNDQAGEDQKQQQLGGKISGRGFIPLDQARTGGDNKKKVRKKNQYGVIKNQIKSAIDTDYIKGSRKQKYIVGVAMAGKSGKLLIHKSKKGNKILYRVTFGAGISFRGKSYKVEPLYSIERQRSVQIKKPQPFVQRAGIRSRKKAPMFFAKFAKRRIQKMSK